MLHERGNRIFRSAFLDIDPALVCQMRSFFQEPPHQFHATGKVVIFRRQLSPIGVFIVVKQLHLPRRVSSGYGCWARHQAAPSGPVLLSRDPRSPSRSPLAKQPPHFSDRCLPPVVIRSTDNCRRDAPHRQHRQASDLSIIDQFVRSCLELLLPRVHLRRVNCFAAAILALASRLGDTLRLDDDSGACVCIMATSLRIPARCARLFGTFLKHIVPVKVRGQSAITSSGTDSHSRPTDVARDLIERLSVLDRDLGRLAASLCAISGGL
jgi:hypothetical protein